MRKIIIAISTFFYVGYLPLIPGTFGTAAGIVLFYFIRNNTPLYFLLTGIITLLGFFFAGRAEEILHKKDARCIVIDEVSGILLAFLFIPYDIRFLILGFFFFRLLDTFKPYPAGRLERLKGSAGIMGDDLIAGFYTNLILQALNLALKIR